MIFRYARVNTSDQSLDLQIGALLQEGIERKNIHTDKILSTAKDRKSLNRLWDFAWEGDTIVVWKLDRNRDLRPVGNLQGHLLQVFADSRSSGKTKAEPGQIMIFPKTTSKFPMSIPLTSVIEMIVPEPSFT